MARMTKQEIIDEIGNRVKVMPVEQLKKVLEWVDFVEKSAAEAPRLKAEEERTAERDRKWEIGKKIWHIADGNKKIAKIIADNLRANERLMTIFKNQMPEVYENRFKNRWIFYTLANPNLYYLITDEELARLLVGTGKRL